MIQNIRIKPYFLGLLLLVILLDALLFRYLFWQIPNESAWAGQPYYNFVWRLRKLQDHKIKNEFRILIVGSSVALYSVLPEEIEKNLRIQLQRSLPDFKRSVHVYLLSHHGMTPLHLLAYQNKILATDPDLVVLPTNPVDLRLERHLANNKMEELANGERSAIRRATLRTQARYLLKESSFQVIAPQTTLYLYGADLEMAGRMRLLWSGASAGVRYMPILNGVLDVWRQNHTARGRHYHYYNGQPVAGLTRRGWIARRFAFQLKSNTQLEDWWLQLRPEAVQQNSSRLSLYICEPAPVFENIMHSIDAIQFNVLEGQCHFTIVSLRTGWQQILIERKLAKKIRKGQWIVGKVSHAYYDPAVADERSLRFTRNFGLAQPRQRLRESRPLRREDVLYKKYSDTQYYHSFTKRILNFDRAGMQYLHALKLAKQEWSSRRFDRGLPVAQSFERVGSIFQRHNMPYAIVNTPENPISLQWYGNSEWYRGYLLYLQEGAGASQRIYDLRNLNPLQEFYDYHHLSYFGARRFSKRLAEILLPLVANEFQQHSCRGC